MYRSTIVFVLLATGSLFAQDGVTGALSISKHQFNAQRKIGPIAGAASGQSKSTIRHFMPTPRDQGKLNSCVAFSVGYAVKTYMEHRREGWADGIDSHLFSPAFAFDVAAAGNPNWPGQYIRVGLGNLQGMGICTWKTWPYDSGSLKVLGNDAASMAAWNEADLSKDHERWDPIDTNDFKLIKAYLVGQHPIVIGANVDTTAKKWQVNAQGVTEKLLQHGVNYHAMVLIGFDDAKGDGAFEIMNSWGPDWNDKGYGWIAYSFWKEWVTEAYVVRDKEPKKILAAGGLNGNDLKWLPPGPESKLNGNWGYPKEINLVALKATEEKKLPEAVENVQAAFRASRGID